MMIMMINDDNEINDDNLKNNITISIKKLI